MKILYLAHRVPYPPNKGEKIRSYHHLSHLARTHDVSLLSFADRREDEQWAPVLRAICRHVELVRLDRRQALGRAAAAMALGQALTAAYFGGRAMWQAVRHANTLEAFDIAWASSSAMAPYLTAVQARRRIADFVDVDSEKYREFARHSPPPLRWVYQLEAARMRRLEVQCAAVADGVLFVSEEEAALFRTFAAPGGPVRVVPNGVDTDFFHPSEGERSRGAPNILFTGALDYRPNADAALFFARQVLPLVRKEFPNARFTAVGHRPSGRLLREAKRTAGAVAVEGSVPDVRPYFADAHVYAAPLRFGRGVKNKVLEAMATGVPIVATQCAVQGLAVEDGKHVLLAGTATELAAAVSRLLRDPVRARRLADTALHWVREVHRWDACLQTLDACLESLA